MRWLYPKFDGKPVTRTFYRMLSDCRKAGWTGTLTSGKRSYLKQLELYNGYLAGKPGYNPANPPDTSRHCKTGWRCAVDVTEGEQLERIARLRRWPVVRPYIREPWHLEFRRKPVNTHQPGVKH